MLSGEWSPGFDAPEYGAASAAKLTVPIPLLSGYDDRAISEHVESPRYLTNQEILADMQANAHIPIANGYWLVPDYRPAGQEDEYIPQETFTWYFWNGMVPYASSGEHRVHDRRHGPSYNHLFQSPSFAGCVRESAGASYTNGRSFNFTRAMDYFGDRHVLLTTGKKPDVEKGYGHILDARLQLRRLIQLSDGTYASRDHPLNWQQNRLFGSIWHQTGFDGLESMVGGELSALPAHERKAIMDLYAPDPHMN